MALTTPQLRAEYAPACAPQGDIFLPAWTALDSILRLYAYAPRSHDTGFYVCRPITGGKGHSLHSYGPGGTITFWNGLQRSTGLALDLNWQLNPYSGSGQNRLITDMPPAMVGDILTIRTNSNAQVFGWGGNYRTIKDPMHYEIVCRKRDLLSGINPKTVKGYTPAVTPGPPRVLKTGMEGGDVQLAQLMYNMVLWAFHWREDWDHNGQGLTDDGQYGPKTQKAMQGWERWFRDRQLRTGKTDGLLTPDGYLTVPSWHALEFDVNQAKKYLGVR